MSDTEPRLVRPRLRFERNYTQLPNAWLRDRSLSFKARGLLSMLFSHETGFGVTLQSLANDGPDGVSAIRSAVEELEAAGYIRRVPKRNRQGHDWYISDPHEPVENVTLSTFENRTGSGSASEKRMRKSHAYKNTSKEDLTQSVKKQPQRDGFGACGHELVTERYCLLGCPPEAVSA